MKQRAIAIYGGSFDPITKAHLEVVEELLDNKAIQLDEVWIVPCGKRKDKPDLLPG